MNNDQRRVVVTGIGLVTPLGNDTSTTWQGILSGRSGIGQITQFDTTEHPVTIAGEVRDFDISRWLDRKNQRKMDRFIHFSIGAAMMALEDADLPVPVPDPHRTGVLIGVGLGGLKTIEDAIAILNTKGPRRLSPFMLPRLISNLAPGQVSIMTGAQGPNWSPVSACATGAHGLGEAVRMIRDGMVDVAISGGAEATITPLGVAGFAAMKALSKRNQEPQLASRPFDVSRDGFVAAEGAGVMVLESLDSARARGARIYAEILGYGQSSDAFHMTLPHPEGRGAVRCMENALADAGLSAGDIHYVNAHGTSTSAGDIAESTALEQVFGEHAHRLLVSSTKSMTGHMLGAAGAVEAAFCVLSIRDQIAPPTINLVEQDPKCRLDYVALTPRPARIKNALSNSFGFGGTNVSLIFQEYQSEAT
ncbi:MAG: beta-ketoacyl-[acyl-carrier-protein] synthase II [Myxococcales bacterium]|nr:beta-ketoacyl-[acyl-carrier-protein] synthase II [Myxococcales bacterium]